MPRLLHYSDVENVYDDPVRVGRLAGALRARNGADALVCGTGDNTSPGVLALIERGRQALDLFCAVDADVETFGNHDFDFGPDAARSIVAAAPQTWVSANVYDSDGGRFAAADVVPHTIETVDGVRIGLFGVTDPATPSLNPMAGELQFTDPYDAAEAAVSELRAAGVDRVVALSHLGSGDDELARRVDVDAILGGHVHAERRERVNGTLLLRPGANGRTIFEVTLDATDGPVGVERHETADAPVADDVVTALRGRVEAAGLDEVVARVERPLDRSESTVAGGECRIGNFVADAYRWSLDADVGLQNSGGIRDGPPLSGAVTVADLVSVIPFEEHVVRAELTGAELLDVFRESAAAVVDFGEPGWWHGHFSGAEIRWDDDATELLGARVDGDPVDPERRYTVATSAYLLHTDHEFPSLEERHRVGEGEIQFEVLAAYAREFGIETEVEGRVRRVSATETATRPSED
ncbi:bifunctional metallophosphatase/5'-nucleotidase [Halobellus limi]|jgi:UDP-sugar diphosphatase|uniref:Bifunctional metallophosphatase/5'-nucleotidase n=1 Tax=Halobellus limi TaxID=699433 RepID=A0A1H5U5X5_9EURY|nr:bifunctional metallophosphatase/5'-nucleotidase [Halobellus limi]QCC47132.1 bifunctional metallophosphatase/5'-nucleotidase [Halobellus limi]SEF70426.1 UDP-sugar diphosphatase [Halobellus limi]